MRGFVIAIMLLVPLLGALRCKDPSQDECYRINRGQTLVGYAMMSEGEVTTISSWQGWRVTRADISECGETT